MSISFKDLMQSTRLKDVVIAIPVKNPKYFSKRDTGTFYKLNAGDKVYFPIKSTFDHADNPYSAYTTVLENIKDIANPEIFPELEDMLESKTVNSIEINHFYYDMQCLMVVLD